MLDFEHIIISIHPNYAEDILIGEKTVELRRRAPRIKEQTKLWIYATRPICAIVGSVVLESNVTKTPDQLWKYCLLSTRKTVSP